MSVYLRDIGFVPGDAVPIEQIDGVSPELARQLYDEGLGSARVFHEAPWRMLADCVRTTLADEAVPDVVVYASEGRSDRPSLAQDTARFLVAAGLDELTVLGAGLNRCANLGSLLMTAGALVDSGSSQHCLVATVDSAGPDERVVNGDIGVFSDAAASAVVSSSLLGAAGFQVLGIESVASAGLGLVPVMRDAPEAASSFLVRAEDAMARLVKRTGTEPHEYAQVLSNNYAASAVEAVHSVVGLPPDTGYCGTARDYSHCFAADGLLNLDSMLCAGVLTDGDRILLLSTSPNCWFLIALRYFASTA